MSEPGTFGNGTEVGDRVDKIEFLKRLIFSYRRVLVAYSGGVDSSFVFKICRDVLGPENVKAIIAKSPSLPASELEAAHRVAKEIGSKLIEIETDEIEDPSYTVNSIRRCYFCKTELYSRLISMAKETESDLAGHPPIIVNGINLDDLGDWRPGLEAARDYGVKSPLVEAGLGKEDIRFYSRRLGLSTWSKPQAACLSSRIPFGTSVTPQRLKQVEQGEEILKCLGFWVVRVRWFPGKALIEVGSGEVGRFFRNSEIRETVSARFHEIGFQSVAVDLLGYRTGRFNPNPKGNPKGTVPLEGDCPLSGGQVSARSGDG